MLTKEDNELVTRIGPGTPMGDAMRRYWMPALLSEELPEPDCPPVRVGLLGEKLVAFRDSNGRVGLLGQHCPHRGASLFFGRNEECGLRCVYHGWKFDVSGQCVDTPNEPPESNFKHKIQATAYPCVERGGVIWTYMGPPAKQPPLPNLEWMALPKGHSFVSKTYEECNYLQGIEGGIDTSHSSFLHRRVVQGKAYERTEAMRQRSTAPKLEVLNTDYGFTYAGIRPLPDDQNYVRVYHFVMPFQQVRAFEGYFPNRPTVQGHMWVPIDDEHTWIYNWLYVRDGSELLDDEILTEERETGRSHEQMLPGYRLKASRENDYFIDREAQRQGMSFTGIPGINTQDVAVQESMGPIYDRSQEHLGTSDMAIIAARKLLLQAARDVQAGRDPLGWDGGSSNTIRPAERVMPAATPWYDGIRDLLVVA
ncbi:MAG TPA: Rieske 2Fe-2S domain-containing protein [Chloroflexota bacterium]|nr:Rieske 2Fe-2S domain-containing protein [Chloroflexota bacterium]